MRPLLLPTLALALAACGSPDPDEVAPEAEREASSDVALDLDGVDLGRRVPGDVVEAVATRDGAMELGVTDSVLFARLSADTRAEIEAEMEAETEDEEGLGGAIARAVTGAVAEGLATAVSVPISDVEALRYEGGRVVIEMADGERSPFEDARSGDAPLLEQFDADAGARLEAAFAKAK